MSQVAQAAFGLGSREAAVWLDACLPKLKATTPEAVIAAIRRLPMPTAEAIETRTRVLSYLWARIDQVRYAHFQSLGYPLGSGMVESGNKLVAEPRMKGAGMHWARTNVTPMVALRGVLCSGRWTVAWPRIWQHLVRQVDQRRREGRLPRQATRTAQPPPTPAPSPPMCKRLPPHPKRVVDGRPTEEHYWKRGYEHRRARAVAGAKS